MNTTNDHTKLENSYLKIKNAKRGFFAINKNDTVIGKSLDTYGEWSEHIIEAISHFIEKECVVLDVGAYIGALTVPIAKLVGDQGRVIAFEPQKTSFDLLQTNITLNALHNVDCLNMAMSDAEGVMKTPLLNVYNEQDFSEFCMDHYENGEDICVNTVDNLGLQRCDFMIVDTPGMETNVIKGASQMLSQCRPIMYVRNVKENGNPALVEELFNQDYKLWWHIQLCHNPENYYQNEQNVFKVGDNEMAHAYMLGVHKSLALPMNGLLEVESPDDNCIRAIERLQEAFVAQQEANAQNNTQEVTAS